MDEYIYILELYKGGDFMYEFECLTNSKAVSAFHSEECSPFFGECYPVGEDCCGPDCNPVEGYHKSDVD